MQALKPTVPIAGTAVVELYDEHAAWNAGRWSITADEGTITVARTTENAGVEMDIRALSQAYWGMPSLDAIRATERMQVHRDTDFEFLCALMPACPVWLTDDF